jgi:hypothetical protein
VKTYCKSIIFHDYSISFNGHDGLKKKHQHPAWFSNLILSIKANRLYRRRRTWHLGLLRWQIEHFKDKKKTLHCDRHGKLIYCKIQDKSHILNCCHILLLHHDFFSLCRHQFQLFHHQFKQSLAICIHNNARVSKLFCEGWLLFRHYFRERERLYQKDPSTVGAVRTFIF